MFNKIHGFIRDYDGTKYLLLYGPENYDAIFDRVRYFVRLKSGITYVDSFNYTKIKIDSVDGLLLEKSIDHA